MTDTKTALVLGATGGIGGAIAAALLRHGCTVNALARDPAKAAANWGAEPSPRWIAGDAMHRADVMAAAFGAAVIVHAVNPPRYRNWDKLVLPMMANTIAAARASGARVVLPGTIYNFDVARTPVVNADTPQRPRTRKGAIRVQLERMLADAAPEVPSLIVRAGDFFGPGARSSWFAQAMVKPGRSVTKVILLTKCSGHSWAYLPDLAETFARLIDLGGRLDPYECVGFEGYYDANGTGMTAAIDHAIGHKVKQGAFPWWLMRLLSPFGGFPREAVEIEQYWQHPLRLDNQRLVALLGKEPRTPIDLAVEQTLAKLGCLKPQQS